MGHEGKYDVLDDFLDGREGEDDAEGKEGGEATRGRYIRNLLEVVTGGVSGR